MAIQDGALRTEVEKGTGSAQDGALRTEVEKAAVAVPEELLLTKRALAIP